MSERGPNFQEEHTGDWGIINIQLAKKGCFNLAIIVEYLKYNVFFRHREMMKEALTQVLQQVAEKTKQKTTTET